MDIRSELDPPFSQPGATATGWPAVREILESAPTCWLTTVRSDGRPHVTPLVAVWHGESMYFCTGADEQKAVNLRAHENVALTTGCNGWQEGIDVVVEGVARRVTDDALLTELAELWATKWDGSWQFEVHDGAFEHDAGGDDRSRALVFEIVIAKVLSFDKEDGAATRHVPA
jgi:general stress protein 26